MKGERAPPRRWAMWGRLPYRQSILTMAIAILLGIVISAGLIGYELVKARRATDEMLRGVLLALSAPATEAAYHLNRATASSVVEALSRFSFVRHAAVYDNFGTILAERRRPATVPALDAVGHWIVDQERAYSLDLVSADLGGPVGRLVIRADGSAAASGVVKTGMMIIGLGILHNVLLAAILAFAFFITLTRPLMALWRTVRGVNPASWPAGAMAVPGMERRDEIGELALALHRFMEMAREQQNHAETQFRERLRVEAELQQAGVRMRRLMESNIIGVFFFFLDGEITLANDAFLSLVGYRREDLMAGQLRWNDLTPPEYQELDRRGSDEIRRFGSCQPYEKEYLRRDGTRVPVLVGGTLFQGSENEGVAFVLDLTKRKRAEERNRLLVDELNHRVKNTLATVQAIVAQTARCAETPELFHEALEGRLIALSQTHNLLNRSAWAGVQLRDIVRDELAPFSVGDDELFTIEGEDIRVAPNPAVTLGMALHELATNAAKYGALSRPGGRIAVAWRVTGAGEQRHLRIEWTESGGPRVREPSRMGFGRYLIEHGLANQLGDVRLEFGAEGVHCVMELIWDRVRSTNGDDHTR